MKKLLVPEPKNSIKRQIASAFEVGDYILMERGQEASRTSKCIDHFA